MTEERKQEVLTIGFSAGSLFDIKELEEIYEKEGLKAYKSKLNEMNENGESFLPGPALGFYLALRKLKNMIPNEIMNIRFGMMSKNSLDYETEPLFRSIRKYIADDSSELNISKEFDYVSFLDGDSAIPYHKAQGADLVFSTSTSSAKDYYNNGIAALYIPNVDAEKNMEMYLKKDNKIILVSDFDGVIGDVHSEMNYQNAKLIDGVDPIEIFRMNEKLNRDIPMGLGPLGNVVKKLGLLVEYFTEQRIEGKIKSTEVPYKTIVVTARGGSAFERFNNTRKKYGINVSQAHLMDGVNKNFVLDIIAKENENANILFIDDGQVHFDRALELKSILSGFVHNDFTVGNLKATGVLSEVLQNYIDQDKVGKNAEKPNPTKVLKP